MIATEQRKPMITADTLRSLSDRTLDEIAEMEREHDAFVTRVQTFEMADGSGRWASMVTMQDRAGHTIQFRVMSPVLSTSPAWAHQPARRPDEYVVEDFTGQDV